LAQLGLAVHSYEFSMEHLPPGVVDKAGPISSVATGQHVSFLVQLLPYIEQRGIAKNFDIAAGTYAPANAPARAMIIPTYSCPSFGLGVMNADGTAGLSNYAGCHHGSETPIDVDNNGVLFLNSKITYGDIFDGSSNTILIGEMLPFADSLGWASGTRSSLRNASEIETMNWQGIKTIPPATVLEVGGFGSSHPGVGMFCFADGSVRGLGYSIDVQLLEFLGNRSDGEMMGDFDY
jgi:prepilin-type processing-associated H-X9-DG protein